MDVCLLSFQINKITTPVSRKTRFCQLEWGLVVSYSPRLTTIVENSKPSTKIDCPVPHVTLFASYTATRRSSVHYYSLYTRAREINVSNNLLHLPLANRDRVRGFNRNFITYRLHMRPILQLNPYNRPAFPLFARTLIP